MARDFSAQEDELLIEMVGKHPILYNDLVPDYRNSYKRDVVWDQIAKTLNKAGDGKECKSRWKNIKDTYYRQKRKNKIGIGIITHPKSKFEHYRRLLTFLESVPQENASQEIGPTDSTPEEENLSSSPNQEHQISQASSDMVISVDPTDIVSSPEPPDIINSEQSVEYPENPIEIHQNNSIQREESTSEVPVKRPGKRGRPKGRYVHNKDVSRQKMIRNYLSMKNSLEGDDEIDLFTRQANSVLKKLPTYFQIKAMHELFDVLTKYKMLAIECPSGIIHAPTTSSFAPESRSGSSFYMMDRSTPASPSDVAIGIPKVTLDNEYSSPVNASTDNIKAEPSDSNK